MEFQITGLGRREAAELAKKLEEYDSELFPNPVSRELRIGIRDGEKLIAGATGSMTPFGILYVDTVYVDKDYRHHRLGTLLMQEVEKEARRRGALLIRLDTFSWQGKDFYPTLGYEKVGSYDAPEFGFSEYFYLKRLGAPGPDVREDDLSSKARLEEQV